MGAYRGFIGIVENTMENTITDYIRNMWSYWGYVFRTLNSLGPAAIGGVDE